MMVPSLVARLVQTAGGNFYGTTCQGGAVNFGTFFKITSAGKLEILHSFTGGKNSGRCPWGIVQGVDGNFYGVTTEGGGSAECQFGCGVVFKITPVGKLTALHDFGGPPDGARSRGVDSRFRRQFLWNNCCRWRLWRKYGYGTVFKITPKGVLTILHSFNFTDGSVPMDLIQGSDGNFYGTTIEGGGGTVLRQHRLWHTFPDHTNGHTDYTAQFLPKHMAPNCPDGYAP